ncbi:hypothetical protein D1831_10940 [Lactiplantibacillus garii]|uniref:Uncharacterized protein n=1 Tax=Lactiplantibacillus garii TaxID=2306423 RepID=A0A3R8QQ03_9LACO|nr:hypothetical protein [Lactiplantibacillus garii]RRK09764.1 hypothetical protein D1831_10940 [Lactiplantibacillus garii]
MLVQVSNADHQHLTALDLKRFLNRYSDQELEQILIKQDGLEFHAAFLQTTAAVPTPTLYLEEY